MYKPTALYALGTGLFIAAVLGIALAGLPLTRSRLTIDGVPVEVMARCDRLGGPAVVVAHGFSGSRQLMYAFGYTLAHHGYTVYLLDFSGHGANTQPLVQDTDSLGSDPLQAELDAVVRYAASRHPGVATLGHSMGAGAVARYGFEHPEVAATIGISTGQGEATRDLPRNLLLMVGAWEFPTFREGSQALLRRAGGQEAGLQYGDPALGSARKLVIVPCAEHILVLFSPRVLAEATGWLDRTFGVQATSNYVDMRMLWVALAYVAALVLARPLAARLMNGAKPVPGALTSPTLGRTVAVFAVAAAGAPFVARVLPESWLPLAVAGYLANYLGIFGLLVLGGAWVLGVARKWPVQDWLNRRSACAAAGLALYLFLAFAVLGHYTWIPLIASPRRLPWLFALLPGAFLYFASGELLIRGQATPATTLIAGIAHKALTLVSLAGAIFFLDAPFFVALMLPVLAVVLVAFGLLSRWVYAAGRSPLPGALSSALAVSAAIAAIFPIVG